jgi:hypothetical protein
MSKEALCTIDPDAVAGSLDACLQSPECTDGGPGLI